MPTTPDTSPTKAPPATRPRGFPTPPTSAPPAPRPSASSAPGNTLQGLAAPVRELARWLHRRGVPAYVLPKGTLPRPARYVPHVYTDRELAALFAQTDHCRYCAQVPLRHLVM